MAQLSVNEALALVPYFDGSSATVLNFMSTIKRECSLQPPATHNEFLLSIQKKFMGFAREIIQGIHFANVSEFEKFMKSSFVPSILEHQWKVISKELDELIAVLKRNKFTTAYENAEEKVEINERANVPQKIGINKILNVSNPMMGIRKNVLEIEQPVLGKKLSDLVCSEAPFHQPTCAELATMLLTNRADEQVIHTKTEGSGLPIQVKQVEIGKRLKITHVKIGNLSPVMLLSLPDYKKNISSLDYEYCQPRLINLKTIDSHKKACEITDFSWRSCDLKTFARSTVNTCEFTDISLMKYLSLRFTITKLKMYVRLKLCIIIDRFRLGLKVPPDKLF